MSSMARISTCPPSCAKRSKRLPNLQPPTILKEHEIPGHVTLLEGRGLLTKVAVETEWSTAEIYLHGAHLTHFQKNGEPPLLFMSEASRFQADQPIRGGVPLIFPWFGPREGLPGHGLIRTAEWTLEETSVFGGGKVMLRFRLPPIDSMDVEYIVRVGETLSMELSVTHTGTGDAVFETCMHTYLHIGAIDTVAITGLRDVPYIDQLQPGDFVEAEDAIRISSEVDRIYRHTPAAVEIIDPTLHRKIRVAKCGSQSTVVWNPWIAKSKAMPDFGDDEYLRMVCVESGNVGPDKITLSSASRAILKVELSSEALS